MKQGNMQADGELEDHSGIAEITFSELQAITNSIPGGVAQFALDENLTLLYANDGFYKISGYTRNDFANKTGMDILEQYVVPEDITYIFKSAWEQLEHSSDIKLEYRITTKSGGIVWVHTNASSVVSSRGTNVLQCVFADITSEKLLRQELLIAQERYLIITERFNDVFFEYNFENDTMQTSSKWEEIFGYKSPEENVISSILSDGIIYDDDKMIFCKIIDRARRQNPNSQLEIRLLKVGVGYIWTSVDVNVICDQTGNPVKIFGKITDIDTRMREREKLISNAQRDPFTKLYNKTAVESFIRTCLRTTENSQHALMIIDIDNFKGINDSLGHLFGDAVLTEISTKLRTLFRSSDIIGRFGGDEFIVFVKNVGENDDKITEKAKAVCEIFRETYTGKDKDLKISGSVGVSVYPKDGENFYELFKKADLALYNAKTHGKDGFVIYGEKKQSGKPKTFKYKKVSESKI